MAGVLTILLLFWCGVMVDPQAVRADDQPVDTQALEEVQEVVKKIQARYEKTKDLQASFVQKTRIEGFSTPVTSTGRFFIKKPGRLRWDYKEPP